MNKAFKVFLTFLLVLTIAFTVSAADQAAIQGLQPEQITIKSATLGGEASALVLKPAVLQTGVRYPVIYLLNNTGNKPSDWVDKTDIEGLVEKYGFIAVMPDGAKGWYLDSPKLANSQYESYITKELVPYIDSTYPTLAVPDSRGIMGAGMGGNGAIVLASKHRDLFGAAASLNGSVDSRRFSDNKDLAKLLGTYASNKKGWADSSAVSLALTGAIPGTLPMYLSVGLTDSSIVQNRDLHNVLLAAGIAHSYTERPGASAWTYLDTNLQEAVAFESSNLKGFRALQEPIKPELVTVQSAALQKEAKFYVLKPDGYDPSKRYPVLYLLHGAWGAYTDWYTGTKLGSYLHGFDMIIVLPDGGQFGWYVDSPVDAKSQYETFITKELVPYIDSHYSTVASSGGRALAGLSMGGHGAVTLAIKHPDLFGSASALSGIVDISRHPTEWELDKRLGAKKKNEAPWLANSALMMALDKRLPKGMQFLISCGVDDFAFPENRDFHYALLLLGISHSYDENPGVHDWNYWNSHIEEHLRFHDQQFKKALASGN